MDTRPKRDIVLDIETNGLNPNKIWCIVCKDINTQELIKFHAKKNLQSGHTEWRDSFKEFIEKEVRTIIGHNIIAYDIYWINKLLGMKIKTSMLIDTLVLSRLFRPVSPFLEQAKFLKTDTRLGGHSLEAWGTRLGYKKQEFKEWDRFSKEMLKYCVRDVQLNHKIYLALLEEREGFSSKCIRLEHNVQYILAQQERNGFYLSIKEAETLYKETTELLEEMTNKLQELFPPVPKLTRNYSPRFNKDGTLGKVSERILREHKTNPNLSVTQLTDGTYELYRLESFNPKSSQQIAERLLSIGWEPRKYTPKGNPCTDKETLAQAIDELIKDNPDKQELISLSTYNIVADRQGKAEKWLSLVESDGRVHGRINPIGAGTHRCAHYNDNMANIASVVTKKMEVKDTSPFTSMEKFTLFDGNKIFLKLEGNEVEFALKGPEGNFGWDSRNCWQAQGKDNVIVGADASGIQLRALAHYINDPDYTKKLIEADIHVVHQEAAGISTRKKAKTFIYAWLLGAGDEKIGTIVGVTKEEYKELIEYGETTLIEFKNGDSIPVIQHIANGLKRQGRKVSKKLLCTCLKGHKVKQQFLDRTPALKRLKTIDIPKATKEGYLVGIDGRKLWIPSEHLAMSLYLQGFEAVIMKYAMCLWHKRLKRKKIPFKLCAFVHDEWCIECHKDHAEEVGQTVVQAIKDAGEELGSRCPLDGQYFVGRSWAEVH